MEQVWIYRPTPFHYTQIPTGEAEDDARLMWKWLDQKPLTAQEEKSVTEWFAKAPAKLQIWKRAMESRRENEGQTRIQRILALPHRSASPAEEHVFGRTRGEEAAAYALNRRETQQWKEYGDSQN